MKKPLFLGSDASGRPVHLTAQDHKTHAHVIGSSGSGKSKFLEHLMRQDMRHRQGFCLIDPHGTLYDAVLDWASHHVLNRKIIMLNLSKPDQVIGFNPFQRGPSGDISVQVDRRVGATMHAWGVDNADQTPTLARTLRLIYTVMIEHNLGLPQVRHLIDFNAHEIRAPLIESLSTELIQQEWHELQQMRAREWREETLSARNRLFKLLTSPTLDRVMGLPGHSINLEEVIEEQSYLLVNLAPSDFLSHENAAVFGALLVNEFFEVAMRRDTSTGDPSGFNLYLDEFQNFVSPSIAAMLDQIRKYGVFLTLAHQRFGQLDEDIIDAVLTNCKIKAVFGGLRAESARMMAQELFIGKLDPMKIKAAIYQTKFWPKYGRDKVYTHGTSRGTTSSTTSTTGGSDTSSVSDSASSSQAYFYDDWFSLPQLSGTRTETANTGSASTSGRSSSWAESSGASDSYSDSESVADVPIFIPVPFRELSSVQYYSLDEQITELTAALKEQFPRHCFLKIQGQETQPLLVPKVDAPYTSERNLLWYQDRQLQQQKALPAAEVDRLLERQETALLQAAQAHIENPPPPKGTVLNAAPLILANDSPIWNRAPLTPPPPTAEQPEVPAVPPSAARKRGPKPDHDNHAKVAALISAHGVAWTADDNLADICDELDRLGVPVPKTWAMRPEGRARSWNRGRQIYAHLVIKAIKDRCKAAATANTVQQELPLTPA